MVWVFILTLWLAGGPMRVVYGEYPTEAACQAIRARTVPPLIETPWSATVCYPIRPGSEPNEAPRD